MAKSVLKVFVQNMVTKFSTVTEYTNKLGDTIKDTIEKAATDCYNKPMYAADTMNDSNVEDCVASTLDEAPAASSGAAKNVCDQVQITDPDDLKQCNKKCLTKEGQAQKDCLSLFGGKADLIAKLPGSGAAPAKVPGTACGELEGKKHKNPINGAVEQCEDYCKGDKNKKTAEGAACVAQFTSIFTEEVAGGGGGGNDVMGKFAGGFEARVQFGKVKGMQNAGTLAAENSPEYGTYGIEACGLIENSGGDHVISPYLGVAACVGNLTRAAGNGLDPQSMATLRLEPTFGAIFKASDRFKIGVQGLLRFGGLLSKDDPVEKRWMDGSGEERYPSSLFTWGGGGKLSFLIKNESNDSYWRLIFGYSYDHLVNNSDERVYDPIHSVFVGFGYTGVGN